MRWGKERFSIFLLINSKQFLSYFSMCTLEFLKLIIKLMINQVEQSSNQYGFYAVPKALEPKKKYRDTLEEQSKYSDEEMEDENEYQTLQRDAENEKELEREFYVNEAPYPEFKPKQRGLDYGVQIQRHQLFDFELEVQPLIEILVGRSVISAINQLQEQKEEQERESFLQQYQKKRNAQLMQTQRLENKHNRKQDEAKRRVLQKQTYVKNKKIVTEKLIARKNAKHGLLNLKGQILGQLEEEGFLRQSIYLGLRVQYESWLYEQIKSIVNQRIRVEEAAQNMIREKEKELKNEHQKNIERQNKRKKDILDERERVRKENEERKLKKRIRKERLHLNTQRSPKFNELKQLVQKYEPTEKILKSDSLSNGLTCRKNTSTTIHIAGGLLNYIIALINESGAHYSPQQIEAILQKLLNQMSTKLEIQIGAEHFAQIEQIKQKIEVQPIQFMTYKDNWIKELIQKISLDISVLEAGGISLKSQLHNNFLNAVMNIYLNALPQPKMEGDEISSIYEPTDRDRKREELKSKIQLISIQSSSVEQLKKVDNVIRVRFERFHKESEDVEQGEKQEQGEKPVDLDEWIDIYDGESWKRKTKEEAKQVEKQNQQGATYNLPGFDQAFVIDERNLYYLSTEIEKLLGIREGEQLEKYKERIQNLLENDQKIPKYDIELKWE